MYIIKLNMIFKVIKSIKNDLLLYFRLFFMGLNHKYFLTDAASLKVPKGILIISLSSKKDKDSFVSAKNHRLWLQKNKDHISIWKIYISDKICIYRLSEYVPGKALLLCVPGPSLDKFYRIIELLTVKDLTIIKLTENKIDVKISTDPLPLEFLPIDIPRLKN